MPYNCCKWICCINDDEEFFFIKCSWELLSQNWINLPYTKARIPEKRNKKFIDLDIKCTTTTVNEEIMWCTYSVITDYI